MEEGGHYYTVYYVSLAAGFNNATANKHAILAQMPDEVGWLDASNMHQNQCFGNNERNLYGITSPVPSAWRYNIENGVHSLPGTDQTEEKRSSAYQRAYTTKLLMKESPVSFKFGILLHRLGDSYAHSYMGSEQTMYTVTQTDKCFSEPLFKNFGHLRHGHDPDFPFLRQGLFYMYLQNLYNVLSAKANEPESKPYRHVPSRQLQYHQVRSAFMNIFERLESKVRAADKKAYEEYWRYSNTRGGGRPLRLTSNDTKALWLIEEIRQSSVLILDQDMGEYRPEKEEGFSLPEFLRRRPELHDMKITPKLVEDTVLEIISQ